MANKENRLIITFDRDYGELIFRHKIKPATGVLYLRLHTFSPESPASIVRGLLNNDELDFSLKLTVFDGQTIRQRRYEKR